MVDQAPWAGDVEPTLAGARARAWRVTTPPGDDPREVVHVCSWLVHAPNAHPFWAWHAVACITLRELPGIPAPKLRFPEAAYEVLVLALNPETPVPRPDAAPVGSLDWLSPPDFVGQFPLLPRGDDGARELVELLVDACCAGRLVPDDDYAGLWERTLTATVDHVLTGHRTPQHG